MHESNDYHSPIYPFRSKVVQLFENQFNVNGKTELCWEAIKTYLPLALIKHDEAHSILWIKKATMYIDCFGTRFSKQDHIDMTKFIYEVILSPDIPHIILEKLVKLFLMLLKLPELLSPNDLRLDWRPLYNTYIKHLCKEEKLRHVYHLSGYCNDFEKMIRRAKYYFPNDAAQGIFDEQAPFICPMNSFSTERSMMILQLFLPYIYPEGEQNQYVIWLDTLLTLWKSSTINCKWEETVMGIFANLAKNNVGLIDWSPYLPFVYSKLMSYVIFPVSYEGFEPNKPKSVKCLKHVSAWIVASLGGNQEGMKYLRNFLSNLSTYYKTPDHGCWTMTLVSLYESIVFRFVNRLKKERERKNKWIAQTPTEFRLTDSDIDEFVDLFFHTDIFMMNNMHFALNWLASLRPRKVIPPVMDRFHTCVTDVLTPLQYSRCLKNVLAICNVIVNGATCDFPEGVSYVIPLINAILNKTSVNDLQLAESSFDVISALLAYIPIIDSTRFASNNILEETVNVNSGSYVDMLASIWKQLFSVVQSTVHLTVRLDGDNEEVTSLEYNVQKILTSSLKRVLENLSTPLFTVALRTLKDFVLVDTRDITPIAKTLGSICMCFAQAKPVLTMQYLVPPLADRLCNLLSISGELAGDATDDEVVYALTILSYVASCRSHDIVKFLPSLKSVLDRALKSSNKKHFRIGGSLLDNILMAVTYVNIRVSPFVTRYENSNTCPLRDWGMKRFFNELETQLIRPSEENVNIARLLIKEYIEPEIDNLMSFSASGTLIRSDLERALIVVRSILGVDCSLLPMWDESPVTHQIDGREQECLYLKMFHLDMEIKLKEENLRRYIIKLLASVQEKLLEVDEDNIDCLILISNMYEQLVLPEKRNSIHAPSHVPYYLKSFSLQKPKSAILYQRQKIEIAHYELRTFDDTLITPTHIIVIKNLFQLCTSKYEQISNRSVMNFLSLKRGLPFIFQVLPSLIEEALQLKPEMDSPSFKGILTLFNTGVIRKDSEECILSQIWPLFMELYEVKVGTSIDEVDKFIMDLNFSSDFYQLDFKWPEAIINLGRNILSRSNIMRQVSDSEIEEWQTLLVSDIERKSEKVESLKTSLIGTCNLGNVHWRRHYLCLIFIKQLYFSKLTLRNDVIQLFLSSLLHSSLVVRDEAMVCCSLIFWIIQKRITTCELIDLEGIDTSENWSLGEDDSTDLLQLGAPPIILNGHQIFIHNSSYGYCGWPKSFKIKSRVESEDGIQIVDFFDDSNLKLFINFLLARSERFHSFSTKSSRFHRGLFKVCPALVPTFLKHIEPLVDSSDELSHSVAAEIITGILVVLKDWDQTTVDSVWDSVIPMLKKGIAFDSSDALSIYGPLFSMISTNRDPNSLVRLYDLLSDWSIEGSDFSSVLFRKMYYMDCAIMQLSWKLKDLNKANLDKLMAYIDHPYQLIRNAISSTLSNIYRHDLEFNGLRNTRSPKLSEFFANVLPVLDILMAPTSTMDQVEKERYQKASNMLATVCRMITVTYNGGCALHPILYELLPFLLQVSRDLDDGELGMLCDNTLGILAVQSLSPEYFPVAFLSLLQTIEIYVQRTKLKIKAKIAWLKFSKVFVFHNLHHAPNHPEQIQQLNGYVLMLLEDESVEVRMTARITLRDFIHCNVSFNVPALIDTIRTKSDQFCVTRGQRAGACSVRSFCALGLLSIVDANPHSIPGYLRDTFYLLSRHLGDPYPIPSLISKSYTNFKTTHLNSWEEVESIITTDVLQYFDHVTLSYFS